MSRTLTQMRSDVRSLLNAPESDSAAPYSNAEVDLAINRACDSIGALLASNNFPGITKSTTISFTNGTATLPDHSKIYSVFYFDSGSTYTVRLRQGSLSSRVAVVSDSGTLAIDYVDRHTAPTSDSDTITYCSVDLKDLTVDQFCAYMAASDLLTKYGVPNKMIDGRLPILEKSVLEKLQMTFGTTSYTNTTARDNLRWAVQGQNTLKIFR